MLWRGLPSGLVLSYNTETWSALQRSRWRRAAAALSQTTGGLWSGLVRLTVSSLSPARGGSARLSPSRPWVPWASVPHFPWSSAPLRLPPCPARGAALGARFPIPCVLPWLGMSLTGSCPDGSSEDHARACGHPGPHARQCRPGDRWPRARSTTVAAHASRCPPILVVLVSVPPRRAEAAKTCPRHRHVNNGQMLRTALSLWHLV